MTDITIRPATDEDNAAWTLLWQDYCSFYNADISAAQTALTWSRILDPDHAIGCFVAVHQDSAAILGFSTFFAHPSTWNPNDDLYLEDLYVAPSARGTGIGGKLIANLRLYAKTQGYARLYWHTNSDNHRARILYDKIMGGIDGYVRYRMSVD